MITSLPSATNSDLGPIYDEIAQRARELWVKAGQPALRDDEFWFGAEQRLIVARQEPDVSREFFRHKWTNRSHA